MRCPIATSRRSSATIAVANFSIALSPPTTGARGARRRKRTFRMRVRSSMPSGKDGRYALVSNSNPLKRDPLTIALSDDGLVYTKLFYLVGGRAVDYPHMMEHEGFLYIAHSGGKRSVEIQRVRVTDLNAMAMPAGRP